MDDRDLIEHVRAGRGDAYGALVERHRRAVFRLCRAFAGNVPDAEDLAQDAFVEAFLKLGQLRDGAGFGPWVRTIARNVCRQWYRRQRLEVVELVEEPAAEAPATDETTPVVAGLSRLAAAQRVALVLHCWEGLSYEETARFLGVPAGTVMSRIHRARRELQRLVSEMGSDEEVQGMSDEEFTREIEAEIRALSAVSGQDQGARERLSVLLRRPPERFVQLIRQADGAARAAIAKSGISWYNAGREPAVFPGAVRMRKSVELFNEYQDPEEARELYRQMRKYHAGISSLTEAIEHITQFRREVGPMIVDGRPTCLCANVWEACHQIEAMGKWRLRWAVPLLARLLYHQDPDFAGCPEYAVKVQAAAARALGEIGDPRAVPPLLAKLDDGPTYAHLPVGGEGMGLPRVELDEAVTAALEALDALGAQLVDG